MSDDAPVTQPDLDALSTDELIAWTKGWPMVRENSERGKWVRSILRALAAERARADQAAEKAWDEGYIAVPAEPEDRETFVEDAPNPYRATLAAQQEY